MPGSKFTAQLPELPGLTVRAWCLFGAAGAILKSSGATFVRVGAGSYRADFSPAMADANVFLKMHNTTGAAQTGMAYSVTASTTAVAWNTAATPGGGATDVSWQYVAIYG